MGSKTNKLLTPTKIMIIHNIEVYLDGGTIEITTDSSTYCFDKRVHSTTEGSFYEGYPLNNNSNIIQDSTALEEELIPLLKEFKYHFYQSTITDLINILENKNNLNNV